MQQKYGWSAGSVGSTAGNNGYNADLQYALKQSGMTADQYRQDLLNRVGTLRSDGRYVTQAEIDTELNRLGLSNMQQAGQSSLYKVGETVDLFGDGQLWVFNGQQLVPMSNNKAPTYGNNQYPSFGGNSAAMDYYQQAMAQAEAAQKARLEALMGQIDAQRPGIQSQADDAARQAYINQRLGSKRRGKIWRPAACPTRASVRRLISACRQPISRHWTASTKTSRAHCKVWIRLRCRRSLQVMRILLACNRSLHSRWRPCSSSMSRRCTTAG